MRIAYLSAFYPFRGGIAQFNASLYRALEKNHQVKAFTFTRQYPDFLFPGKTQMVAAGDKADKIPSERMLNTMNPFSYYSAATSIKKYEPDLLLMKYWTSYMAPSLGTVARKIRSFAKVITVLGNVIPHERRFFDGVVTKYFLKQNHGFVVMSDAVKADLLKFIPDAKYIFYPHPLYGHFGEKMVATDARKKLNIPEGKKVILFFGFIRDYKGLDLIIDAMAKLTDEYLLIICGEVYGSFEKYQKQIDLLGVQNRILLYVRYINDQEVPVFFSASDVCVLPYKSATQSGITSIAYHFNLPLIATNVGGLKENIIHNKTGIVVDYPDADMLSVAIKNYFTMNQKEKFSEEISQFKKKLSWDEMANAIIDFSNTLK